MLWHFVHSVATYIILFCELMTSVFMIVPACQCKGSMLVPIKLYVRSFIILQGNSNGVWQLVHIN